MELWQIWIIAALVLFVVEIATSGFAAVCLSLGALVAAIAAGCGASLTWQVVVFAVASLVALVFFRPVIIRLFHNRKSEERKSGVEALIGREAVVTETIDEVAATGRVRIDGDDWKAVAADSAHIEKGEKVVVLSIESIVLTVKPKQ